MGSQTPPQPRVLMTGIAFGESPRWHEGRLWFSDWGAEELIAVDLDGNSEVIMRRSLPRSAPSALGARRIAGDPR